MYENVPIRGVFSFRLKSNGPSAGYPHRSRREENRVRAQQTRTEMYIITSEKFFSKSLISVSIMPIYSYRTEGKNLNFLRTVLYIITSKLLTFRAKMAASSAENAVWFQTADEPVEI